MNAYTCDNCGRINVAWTGSDHAPTIPRDIEEFIDTMNDWVSWVPKRSVNKTYDDVPDHIASAAREAHECMNIDAFRGAVALARAVVEATAKEKGITSGKLHQKINRLFDDGHIRLLIKDAAHEIRYLGNDVAHGDFTDPVTKEEAEETLGLMDDLLEEVFQMPARVERRRAARESKKEADKAEETPQT